MQKHNTKNANKTIAVIGLAGVVVIGGAIAYGYLIARPGDRTSSEPRELTKAELARRCGERFYGEVGRQCIRDVYSENSALHDSDKVKRVYGLE